MSKKIKLSSITPDDKNNNKHTAYGMDLLEKSVNKVGIIESITVSNDDKIISGNARHEVIGKNFTKEALVIETDGTQPIIIKRTDIESDTKQFYEASILANTTSKKNIDFDMDVIDALVEEYDIDAVDLGVDIVEEITEAEEDDFNGTLPKEPITVLGDLYEIGEHRLLCGSSTEADAVTKLLNGKEPYLMVTDPPYGVNYDPNWRNEADRSNGKSIGASALGQVQNDDNADWTEAWALSPCKVAYVYHDPKHSHIVIKSLNDCSFEIRSQIIWVKNNMVISRCDYHPKHEPLWYAVKKGSKGNWASDRKQTTVWEINKNQKNETGHSTQKPIECMAKPIANHDGDVHDPFLGSGTTMVASHQLKRKCYGMELDPKYCDVIVARMIKLDSTLPIKRNGVLLTNSEVLKFTENTSESN